MIGVHEQAVDVPQDGGVAAERLDVEQRPSVVRDERRLREAARGGARAAARAASALPSRSASRESR